MEIILQGMIRVNSVKPYLQRYLPAWAQHAMLVLTQVFPTALHLPARTG
jgi:hypothetical protein